MNVSVCIASIGRDTLLECVTSIISGSYTNFEIVVCDNSPDFRAGRLIERHFPEDHRIAIVHVPKPNIADARNACLDRAIGRFIAFIDDDERASREWLSNLVNRIEVERLDVVFGPAEPKYQEPPAWVQFDSPYAKSPREENPVLTGSTCNVLIRRASITRAAICFNPAFGETGGEDLDFFVRLKSTGALFGCAPDAFVEEDVPPHRMTDQALKARSLAAGRVYARVFLSNATTQVRFAFLIQSLLKYAIFRTAADITWIIKHPSHWSLRRRAWGNQGRAQELRGASPVSAYGLNSR